jgi:quinol-cytochrome oxidoreductase complex cytochrome b subunit
MVDYRIGRSEDELEPFFPNEILRHTLLTFLLINSIMLGVLYLPESYYNSIDGSASSENSIPWFLLPFYYVSGLVDNKALYILIISLYAVAFIGVPFLDRNGERRLWKKPVFFSIVLVNLLMILALGIFKYIQW